jgi:2-C-methyl-D-erythritol 4-phosphate cytidylyltransferase
MSKFAVLIAAAGGSTRFKDGFYKKPFAPLDGRAVWLHSAERFVNRPDVCQVIVIIAEEDREEFDRRFAANTMILGLQVCVGGKERVDSVANGLAKVKDAADFVVVHDAARPCVAEKWIDQVFAAAEKNDAAILAIPINETLKRASKTSTIAETVDRTGLWAAQTPQVFRRELLIEAYAKRKGSATDDAQLVEQLGKPVTIVAGSPLNVKITTKEDLRLAEQILKVLPKSKPEGFAHPFAGDDMWR